MRVIAQHVTNIAAQSSARIYMLRIGSGTAANADVLTKRSTEPRKSGIVQRQQAMELVRVEPRRYGREKSRIDRQGPIVLGSIGRLRGRQAREEMIVVIER